MDYLGRVLSLANRMRIISLDKKNIYLQAKYGPSKIVKIPLKISEDLACFVAIIIGDGHLRKNKFTTSIEISNKELLIILSKVISELFDIKPVVKKVKKRDGKTQTYHLTIYSKAVQELLNIVFEIQKGIMVCVKRCPKHSSPKKRRPFRAKAECVRP